MARVFDKMRKSKRGVVRNPSDRTVLLAMVKHLLEVDEFFVRMATMTELDPYVKDQVDNVIESGSDFRKFVKEWDDGAPQE